MTEILKTTPLTSIHQELGAKIVPFAGFSMPIRYQNITDEHHIVRNKVGLFDLCHMGRILVSGKESTEFLQYIITNDVAKMKVGQARYSLILNESGCILDDIIVYRRVDNYMVVCNGANLEKIDNWLKAHQTNFDVQIQNDSDNLGMIAIQGKNSLPVVLKLIDIDVTEMKYYYCGECHILGSPGMVARTGYTGEDGFELYLENEKLSALWKKTLEIGAEYEIAPIGLAARDTLRLEAGMPLYGHEIDETTNPLEAGLNFGVKLKKKNFIGLQALLKIEEQGISRKLVCLELEGKRIARQGSPILKDGKEVGYITSGTMSPTLEKSIAMGYVPFESSEEGQKFEVLLGNKPHTLCVVKGPFYRREK